MTRINLVDPAELSTKHLVAEYREIMRLPGNLATSLNRKGKKFDLKEIPEQYTLGTGHVKFFSIRWHSWRSDLNYLYRKC